MEELDGVVNQLLMGGLEQDNPFYGSEDNFYFLVVWEGNDYTWATWEDQHVIFKDKNITDCLQLTKYLLYRKLESVLQSKKQIQPVYQLFAKYFPLLSQSKLKELPLC